MIIKPTVSVILTTFNSAKTLQPTIDSIRSQQGAGIDFDLELIVIDDCSADRTRDILIQNQLDFHTTGKNTGGPNRGRNIGLDKACGDFICLIDHDDIWAPDKINNQLKVAQFYPVVSTASRVIDTFTGEEVLCGTGRDDLSIYPKNQAFLQRLSRTLKAQRVCLSSIMIQRQLRHIKFEEHFGYVDFDWYLRLLENQSSAEIARPLVTRYLYGSNLSQNRDFKKKDYLFTLAVLERYKQRYPREVKLAKKRLNSSLARSFSIRGEMSGVMQFLKKSSLDVKFALHYLDAFSGDHLIEKQIRVVSG